METAGNTRRTIVAKQYEWKRQKKEVGGNQKSKKEK